MSDYLMKLAEGRCILKSRSGLPFALKWGERSPFYFDADRLLYQPAWAERVARQIDFPDGVSAVCAVAHGGTPLAFALANRHLTIHGLVMAYDTEEMRWRGTHDPGELRGHRVLIVDDVLTSGRSIGMTAEAIRQVGAEPVAAWVMVDRSGGHVDMPALPPWTALWRMVEDGETAHLEPWRSDG